MKMTRNSKRALIICIYFLIFGVIGSLLYYLISPGPTCSDGKKNQGETGIDCGGPCAPCEKEINAEDLVVEEQYFVYGDNDRFDVMAKIKNPNNQYGAGKIKYRFDLTDQSGAVLATQDGENFILPGETKYIIDVNLASSVKPYTVKFSVTDVEWEEFLDYEEPKLSIYNKDYWEDADKNTVFGLLRNESYFDFNFIEIDIVLRGGNGKPLALGKYEMRTVKTQEERDFKVFWPYKFSGEVKDVEIKAEANVFDSDNFIKQYLPSNKFQEYGSSE